MTVDPGPLAVVVAIIGISLYADSAETSVRILYAARLVGALLVVTLVPLLIDRRLRR